MIDLDELERLCKEATPGEWSAEEWRSVDADIDGFALTANGYRLPMDSYTGTIEEAAVNAALIAALRNAAPELIAMARRYQWAERNVHCIDVYSDPDNYVRVWYGDKGSTTATGRTLSAAIDAAMEQKP